MVIKKPTKVNGAGQTKKKITKKVQAKTAAKKKKAPAKKRSPRKGQKAKVDKDLAVLPEAETTLTDEEELFCWHYCRLFNYSEAYRRTYPGKFEDKEPGETDPSLWQGWRMAKRPQVAKRIKDILDIMKGEAEETVARIFQEQHRIAFANAAQILNDDGTIKDLSELPDELAAAIHSVKRKTYKSKSGEETEIVETKLYDKQRSLEQLARMLGVESDLEKKKTDSLRDFLDQISGKSVLPPGLHE